MIAINLLFNVYNSVMWVQESYFMPNQLLAQVLDNRFSRDFGSSCTTVRYFKSLKIHEISNEHWKLYTLEPNLCVILMQMKVLHFGSFVLPIFTVWCFQCCFQWFNFISVKHVHLFMMLHFQFFMAKNKPKIGKKSNFDVIDTSY